ncbi:MAG: HAD-IB family phosphatase [Candidatus Micrarchaeia archaeon]
MPAERPRVVSFFDADRTLVGQDWLLNKKFMDALVSKGLFPEKNRDAIIENIARTQAEMKQGQENYEEAVARTFRLWTEGLAGQNPVDVEREGRRFAQQIMRRTPGGPVPYYYSQSLVRAMKEYGPVVMLSAAPIEVVAPLAEAMGFDHAIGTQTGVKEKKYDGRIISNCHDDKVGAARNFLKRKRWTDAKVVAFGDSRGDLLLGLSHAQFLLNPGIKVLAETKEKGIPVITREEYAGPEGSAAQARRGLNLLLVKKKMRELLDG